jgi:hypothetical protein
MSNIKINNPPAKTLLQGKANSIRVSTELKLPAMIAAIKRGRLLL